MKDIESIHDKLGLKKENGLYFNEDGFLAEIKKIKKLCLIEDFRPHSVYCIDEKPFILFYDNPANKKALFKAIWNLNEVPVVIISEPSSVTIYNGFNYIVTDETLSQLGSEDELGKFDYFRLVSGETWDDYKNKLSYKNRVDYKLLENIKAARDKLIKECGLDNETANALLGRAIFVRYLIDRKVRIAFQTEAEEWTNDRFCELLADKNRTEKFFDYLKDRFNGDLFPINKPETEIGEDALKVIINLLQGEEIRSGQLSLFEIYDFSIIPVEFISNIYELFIGQEEQEKTGSYYTPLFMVEYITSKTVNEYFEKHESKYDCKVLDPACGSGIFLVEILRSIIDRFINLHQDKLISAEQLTELLVNNIYGVDKDFSAVYIAIFSLYLTLLDYQSPKDIENFKFPPLFGTNFFVADFFATGDSFNNVLAGVDFDYIVGNPPWKRGASKDEFFVKYITERKQREGKREVPVTISNKEIAQAFILRVSDFSSPNTIISFIITGSVIYKPQGKNFRKYFLTNYFINEVLDLSSVRKEVFEKSNDPSVAPPVIITYRYADKEDTRGNRLNHYSVKPNRFFTLFKLFLIQGKDIKTVTQSMMLDNDWLWKLLVYGSFLDFFFVKRIKESYCSINNVLLSSNSLHRKGIIVGTDRKHDVKKYIGIQYLDTQNDVKPFYIDFIRNRKWDIPIVERSRREEMFQPPLLLVREGVSPSFRSVSGLNPDKYVLFKNSLTGIQSSDICLLKTISGYLYSSLFAYYALILSSSAGINRTRMSDEEKFGFPYLKSCRIYEIVNELHRLKVQLYESNEVQKQQAEDEIKGKIEELEEKIDLAVIDEFKLNEIEKSLVDYGVNYTIPSIMKQKNTSVIKKLYKPLKPDKDMEYLKEYTDVFYQRFTNYLREKGKSLKVEIIASKDILGIVFHFDNESNQDYAITVSWKDNNQALATIIQLGHNKITDQLFLQKDIRGFEKDSFYIFKPNEKMLWHKAIAYLDMNDCVDA